MVLLAESRLRGVMAGEPDSVSWRHKEKHCERTVKTWEKNSYPDPERPRTGDYHCSVDGGTGNDWDHDNYQTWPGVMLIISLSLSNISVIKCYLSLLDVVHRAL